MATSATLTTPTASLLAAPYKIIIVEGQRHKMPVDVPMDSIKEFLGTQYAGISTATIKEGKEVIEGLEVTTYEFVKVTGTKGLAS